MTDLLIGIANTTPSGNVVFRKKNPDIFRNSEMRHSKSEDILGVAGPGAPTRTPSPYFHEQSCASEDDLVASSALRDASSSSDLLQDAMYAYGRRSAASPPPTFGADRVDPEDSIRDIVTENDLYRFVLFKRHYDKYITLAEKYEESRGVVYYLEERYHEVKAEKDKLEEALQDLEKRLENHESQVREKEEELFLHLERSLRLDDEIERLKAERDSCITERERLEREHTTTLRQLQLEITQNEITRRNLERARLDIVRQATVIRAERDAFEGENNVLKEKLRVEQVELGEERRKREEEIAILTREAVTLRHAARHLRAAALHATVCKRRRRCSVCIYAKRTFSGVDECRKDGKLFKCLQTPLQDLKTWFRPGQLSSSSSSHPNGLRPSSRVISYMDSSSSSEDEEFGDTPLAEISMSSTNSGIPPASRAFSSDSGYVINAVTPPVTTLITPTSTPIEGDFSSCSFSSEIGDRRSRRSYDCVSHKVSESSSGEPDALTGQRSGPTFNRSKWTSSFRKLLGRKSKAKMTKDLSTS